MPRPSTRTGSARARGAQDSGEGAAAQSAPCIMPRGAARTVLRTVRISGACSALLRRGAGVSCAQDPPMRICRLRSCAFMCICPGRCESCDPVAQDSAPAERVALQQAGADCKGAVLRRCSPFTLAPWRCSAATAVVRLAGRRGRAVRSTGQSAPAHYASAQSRAPGECGPPACASPPCQHAHARAQAFVKCLLGFEPATLLPASRTPNH